jgi:hypothetical protein
MTYSYEIVKDDNIQETMITEYDNNDHSNNPEMWFLITIKFYRDAWSGNPSFLRTSEWVKANYPELLL